MDTRGRARKSRSAREVPPVLRSVSPEAEIPPRQLQLAQQVIEEQEDRYMQFLLRPRSVTFLSLCVIFLVYYAFEEEGKSTEHNIKFGVFAGCIVFLFFSAVQLRETVFSRPHPSVWRIVTGCSVLYLLFLVFLLFQNVDDARQLFRYMYDDLGKPLPERSYGEDCRLFTPDDDESMFRNLRDTVMDEFMLAHLLGWWGKALIVRDAQILWILSLGFEFIEYSFQHMLANFKECWWDHWIIDVLICNWAGMWLGLQTCHLLEVKEYKWPAFRQIRTTRGRLKRAFLQFTPMTWDKFEWNPLSSPKRFMYIIALCTVFMVSETNAFFLKYVLWIPPRNPLNSYRLCFWFLWANMSCREFYQFVTDPMTKKLGIQTWLCLLNATVELIICVKFGRGMFDEVIPPTIIIVLWAVLLVGVLSYMIWFFAFEHPRQKKKGL